MNRITKMGIGAVTGIVVLGSAIGIASAVGGDGDDRDGGTEVSGPVADQARAAAVSAVPGGRAGAVEAESDEGATAYRVTVAKPDGSPIGVALDRNFLILGTQDLPGWKDGDDDGD